MKKWIAFASSLLMTGSLGHLNEVFVNIEDILSRDLYVIPGLETKGSVLAACRT
jgi:hypothetical protein